MAIVSEGQTIGNQSWIH